MKVNIETLKDTFKIGYEQFQESREESRVIMDLYHNRQYTADQIATLERRGQPRETFNIIKTFGRLLLGYYSTVVNAIRVTPKQQNDVPTAGILNDLVEYIFRTNNFIAEGEKIKLDLILNGLMCAYLDVEELEETDEYNRPKYKINMHHVPVRELVLDPMSRLDDYSDARFTHRFKWVSEEDMKKHFGASATKDLREYYNASLKPDADFFEYYNNRFIGYSKQYNVYQLIHTIMVDDDEQVWSIYWSGDKILEKKKVTFKECKNPYRIFRLNTNNTKAEYYGIFREVVESQHAINQAIIKIQTMVNTQKVFVEENAVENLAQFRDQVNRVNAIIQVKDLNGIRVENLNKDIVDQYTIIDKALERIQRILSINDSFLGMAYASDSGAKVRLQQNASIVALRYLTLGIEQFYRLLGVDVLSLIKQYYTAHDVIRVCDEYNVEKWLELNKPVMIPTGFIDPNTQQMIMGPAMEPYRDPATDEPVVDENGDYILAPIPTTETDISFTQADVIVDSVTYNDEEERVRMLLESFLSGPLGQMLSQANPAGYFKAGAIAMRETKTKYSNELSEILMQTALGLEGAQQPAPEQQAMMMQMGQAVGQERPKSSSNQQSGL